MKQTQKEKFEAQQRTEQLKQFKKENLEYEKSLYKNERFIPKSSDKLAGRIFGLLFAFFFVCSIGMIFARLVGYSEGETVQTSQNYSADRYGNR